MSSDIQTITNSVIPAEVVVNGAGMLDTLERASIDIQIATAHQYPRSLTSFKERAISIACFDEETANSCIFQRPVGKDKSGRQQYAEGLSVRMAEIVASCYGNLRVGARIVEQTPRRVVVQGMAHDLETNFMSTSEVVEATVTKAGQPYDERMRIVIAKAALAKARRDAIFQVVPKALAKPIEQAVRSMLVGDSEPLVKRRARAVAWVHSLGIPDERVWFALGVQGADDLTDSHLFRLTGLRTAIKDGEVTIDEAFPEIEPKDGKQSAIESAANSLKAKATRATKRVSTRRNSEAEGESESPETPETPAPAQPTPADNAHDQKMQEIETWAQETCSVLEDYEMALHMMGNFANDGQLNPEWLEDARQVIRDVAKRNGINL